MLRVKAFRARAGFCSYRRCLAFRRWRKATVSLFPTFFRLSRHIIKPLLLCLLAISGATSCGYLSPVRPSREAEQTRTVTDDLGRSVKVTTRPQRIISLAPNLTEIVYAVGAGDKLVGVTTYCDYPAAARNVEKVGDTLKPNLERIIALQPDIVLVSTASQLEAFAKQLETQGIAVYVTQPHSLDDVLRSISNVADLLGQRGNGETLVNELFSRIEAVEESVEGRPPVSVFVQISREPLYTAGRESWLTDMIRRAGGQSVTANVAGEWPNYSAESALAAKPEVLILATGDAMGAANSEPSAVFQKSPAVTKQRVYRINGDFLSRPGPRLVNGLEKIAQVLHPQ